MTGVPRLIANSAPVAALLLALVLSISACAPLPPAPIERRSGAWSGSLAVPATYEVVRGDTLAAIAFRYGLDWRDIARWNGLEAPYTIRPGQLLRLSEPPRAIVSAAPRQETPRPRAVETPAPRPSAPAASTQPGPQPSAQSRTQPSTQPSAPPSPQAATGATRSVAGIEWRWPTEGTVVRPFDAAATRRGLGIGGQVGQPVVAAAPGQVVYSGTALIGYGELIIIQHSGALLSAYGHNARRLVEEGQRVQGGQPIAELGLNDRDQPMLHFEIRQDGQPVDPRRFLPPR